VIDLPVRERFARRRFSSTHCAAEFDKEDARQAGEIRALLAFRGTPIGLYDVLIAGQAKARNSSLVTHNTNEFGRVPGLRFDDWQT
jgi:tRNA(fMet)-specific endonuclease VapC